TEHSSLHQTVKSLLEENKRLSKDLNDLLEFQDKRVSTHEQDDLVENLKQQINALISEKDSTTKLWQNSIRTIDFLEDELKIFQAGTKGFIPRKDFIRIKHNYEEKISSLETSLNLTQKKLEDVIKNTSNELVVKNDEVDKSLQAQAGAFKIVKNLESEILNLQKRLQDTEKMKVKLEKMVKDKEDVVDNLKRENSECRAKVREAVEIVAAALNEKDAALFREKAAKDDAGKMNQELCAVMSEAEEKIKNEASKVKSEYNLKYEQLEKDLKATQDKVASKHLEIEKFSTKCMLLENEIEKIRRGNLNIDDSKTSKLLILEKKSRVHFPEAEKQNIQLTSERDSIRNDMEQMAGHYERTLKTKEIEKLTLQNKVKQLKLDLDESNVSLFRLTEKLEGVNSQIAQLEKTYQLQKQDQERSIRQSYSNEITAIHNSYGEKIKALESQVGSLMEINKKWTSETKFIIENLEGVITDLKTEVQKLKVENKALKEKLKECVNKIGQYKTFMQLISQDVNKISSMAIGSGDVT
ncbi:hypothetical protein NQ318_010955, partial [Aromia moschata]